MRLADPELLALLALLLVLYGAWRLQRRRPPTVFQLPALPGLADAHPLRRRLWPFLPLLRVGAVVLVVVAIARPQIGDAEGVTPAEGIDFVLTLDASGSMNQALGGGASRLDEARRVARDFLDRRGEDRVGLVVFQAQSLVLSPLTLDLEALDALLEETVESGLVVDGTALGLALAESIDLLRDSRAASRVVVALTDGEDNIRTVRPVEAAAIAEALGVRIYTIGVVDADARQGPVDELALQFVANTTGGRYFRATDVDELEEAYREIDELERARVGGETFTRYREIAPWLLIPALLLVLAEVAAHATWWRKAP